MLSTVDLSNVTNRLIDLLDGAIAASPLWVTNGGTVTKFTITVSGAMPEQVRTLGDCQLTVYPFHVAVDPFWRNTPLMTGTAAQLNPSQALGLSLYYLVSAYAKNAPDQEQQAMSIALQALHERATYVDAGTGFTFTITPETENADEANRRWQAFSTPFRLSTVYRVGVVFLTPKTTPAARAAPPSHLGLAVGPANLPFARGGALVATGSRVNVHLAAPSPGDIVTYDISPAVIAPGSSFALFGTDLDQPTAQSLFLVDATGTEFDVSAWKGPAAGNTAARLILTLPTAIGVPPNAPEPGVYLLRAGDGTGHRSNAVTMLVTAATNAPPTPWISAGGVFSFTGEGFTAGVLEVLLDTVALVAIAPGGVPAAREFAPNAAGTSISFRPPAALAPGVYAVRLRVKGIEGPPVGRATVP
jgi:hypothetical protein